MKKINAFFIVLTLIFSTAAFSSCTDVMPETLLTSDPATSAVANTHETSAAAVTPGTTPEASDTDDGKTTPTPTSSDTSVKETYGPVIVEGMLKYRLVNDSFYEVYGVDKIKHYDIEIPSEVRGKPVKRIKGISFDYIFEPGAFDGCSDFITVRIHEGITEIGEGAFNACSNLREVIIPASVDKIIDKSFLNCSKLQSFCVAEDNSEYCSIDGVIFTKNKEKLLIYPEGRTDQIYQIPDGVKTIASNAFSRCTYLTSVITSESSEIIEDFAFCSCLSLKSVYISKNVNEIQSSAFLENLQFSSFEVNAENNTYKSVDGVLFSKNGETIVQYPCGKNGEDYQIPEGVKTIEHGAFCMCQFLKHLRLPQSIQIIKGGSISKNQSLETIYIPKNAETIERGAISLNANATINCAVEEKPAGWHDDWQKNNKSVVWGYTEG